MIQSGQQASADPYALAALVLDVVAQEVRAHCTPSGAAYQAGGDTLVYAVADWIRADHGNASASSRSFAKSHRSLSLIIRDRFAARFQPVAEISMHCGFDGPHDAHTWQMSATGYCDCPGNHLTTHSTELEQTND